MSNITVSYAEIEQAAQRLGRGREEISTGFQELHQQVQQLVASGFVTDRASVRLNAAYAEYTASAQTVVARLDEIQQFLLQAAEALRDMDAQMAARIA